MRLLLDTHILLWALLAPERLSAPAQAAIRDPANDVFVSAASAWEMAIKLSLGKLPAPPNADSWLPQQLVLNQFSVLPVTLEHALAVERLPRHHGDPFDRLLIAQAQQDRMTLVTVDPMLDPYGVPLLR